jgi:hypothetical protein
MIKKPKQKGWNKKLKKDWGKKTIKEEEMKIKILSHKLK